MANKFSNNALSTLAGALTSGATSLNVASGDGAKFPALSGSDYFKTTLVKLVAGVATVEIVKVTARAGDVFTIVRGQEGTTATTFSAGDRVELRVTRDTLDNFAQKDAPNIFTDDITMTAASIVEAEGAAVASASTTNIWAGDGNTVHVTGTTTITSFGTAPQAGAWMKVIFDGALTLTQGANLNLNGGGANVTVAADDMALVYADTTTQMDVFVIHKSGASVVLPPASASVLLATLTPTAAATVDFLSTFSSTYDAYLIIGEGIKPSANDTLQFRFANAGAADSGSVYFQNSFSAGGATTTAVTSFTLGGGPTILAAGLGAGFELFIKNANDATNLKTMSAMMEYQSNATPGYVMDSRGGVYNAANAVSGGRFLWSGGSNFAVTGKIRIYGLANT